MKNYQDFCNHITNTIFDIIDNHGSMLQWKKTWEVNGSFALPLGNSGFYRGGNLLSLLVTQVDKGFTDNKWFTFNQIQKLGGTVLKGAKSEIVYFWKPINITETVDGKDIAKNVPIFKTYRVFNIEQTSLADSIMVIYDEASCIREALLKHDVTISTFGNQPLFNISNDVIVMPKAEYFQSQDDYNTTLLHELIHWTGHESRLNRMNFTSKQSKAYAEEELVAEIGSVLLATHFGINGDLFNHASYVASWKKHLTPKEIMRAVNNAVKSFEYVIT